MPIRCCKKGCKSLASSSWLCSHHEKEWEGSKHGHLSRQLTVTATDDDTRKEVSDDLYDISCKLYKEYIMKP